MSAMIAFFSRADENDFSGILRRVEVGNTELVAEMPQRLTGADLFKIEPIQPYSRDDNACVTEAQDDQRRNARPELKAYPDSLSGYDTCYTVCGSFTIFLRGGLLQPFFQCRTGFGGGAAVDGGSFFHRGPRA